MMTQPPAAPRTGAAIVLFSFGIFCFAVNDVVGKWLVGTYPVGELVFVRTCGAAVFLLPMLMRFPESRRLPSQLGLHALRILVLAGDSFAFYFATRTLPLADVMTFYLAAPLFVTAMAVLFLGERIGPWRVFGLLLGFLGVVIALRPSGSSLSLGVVVALAGSLMFATSMVVTRRLRQTHWVTLVSAQFFTSGVIGAMTTGFAWVTPTPQDALLMLLVGLVSMLCFVTINSALRLAPASLLAPFHYTAIVWAVLFGWLVFGDLPTPAMWTGISLILASGGIIWLRERHAGVRAAVEVPAG